MHDYLPFALPCVALLIWIFKPRPFRRPSSPGAARLGMLPPPEDFSAFMWMAALPSAAEAEPRRAPGARPTPTLIDPAQATAPQLDTGAAASVIAFWRAAGPARWFAKDPEFDRRFGQRFRLLHEAAMRGELAGWLSSADGALALLLLLDQYPRNAFRGTPRMYASDGLARCMAERALEAGHDRAIEPELRLFMYLPAWRFGGSVVVTTLRRGVTSAP